MVVCGDGGGSNGGGWIELGFKGTLMNSGGRWWIVCGSGGVVVGGGDGRAVLLWVGLMGGRRQKWFYKEEVALKAGVAKYGTGKWRAILKDPEFSSVLHMRSNVDLKDKWRNMNATTNGSGSLGTARLGIKRAQQPPKRVQQACNDDNPLTHTTIDDNDEESGDARPLPSTSGSPEISGIKRLENLIMEVINNLKEPGGSNRVTIGTYIEERYWSPPNFQRLLSMKLKFLTQTGKLVKRNHKYRIVSSDKGKIPTMIRLEGRQKGGFSAPRVDKGETSVSAKSLIDKDAAAAAAQAAVEAEAVIAEAEEAARVAEAAEA
ncbi:hypothetical protein M8C21_030679, partial [Ambrosia artemisiifolia]